MICLVQYLFWEANGKRLSCKECPFRAKCTHEAKEE